jgi:sugar phosphate permease
MFVAASSGVAPDEQGVASALATTAQQIGGAIGLAALIAVANAGLTTDAALPAVAAGLRSALWIAAGASILGGLFAYVPARASTAAAP